ncbi:zinc finger BED domain-containing protein 4-like [Lampris incognitus]|uniref:zinc finger BED domain-containing protein 4-like n=1 Tax=Lampris incognitus TaxID=2546036 RepID=UPI0024B5D45F|nr:zinc finger BED domain-containing protein 4-like [Lampris incognitus]
MCSDFPNVVFSPCKWAQLKELCTILEPFAEATDLTQGEQLVTSSLVVPTVLDINTHLMRMEEKRFLCRPLVRALKESLHRRFSGIFVRTKMDESKQHHEPFGEDVYFIAAMLDPRFGLSWVDMDVQSTENVMSPLVRDELKRSLKDTLITEARAIGTGSPPKDPHSAQQSQEELPPLKCPRLLARYQWHRKSHSCDRDSSIASQVQKYFETIKDFHDEDTLSFWARNEEKFPNLHSLALKVLSVPASSAPIERVFSRGGLITRPHHSRLGTKMLSYLMFLKCNHALLSK